MAHPNAPQLTIGVDTHLEVHVAHANDQLGRPVATVQIPTTPAGYAQLLTWAHGLGEVQAWGVEGTGCYGAGLARFLAANGQVVVEVNRPDRAARRRHGKSDPVDAQAAARAVQAGDITVRPKAGHGQVEMIRCLRVARSSAVRARTQASNALKGLVVTAPAELREQLRDLPTAAQVAAAAGLEPGPIASPTAAAMVALGSLARLHSEAAFSMLCGASPIQASSGKTTRHRLNRGGDRQANAALYRIVVVPLRYHQPTKDYMARRLAQGKSRKEIIRCLKRYVARQVFAALNPTAPGQHTILT